MGSKSKTTTQIPAYIEQGGKDALAQAQRIQQMGYIPYMGPEVAMYDPRAAMSANAGLDAFGLTPMNTDPMAGAATATMGGMTGYTSAPMLEQAQQALQAKYPGLYDYLTSMTINPVTGGAPAWAQPVQAVNTEAAMRQMNPGRTQEERDARFGGTTSGGGYTSIRDMYDGGGPGASGGSFKGGGMLSAGANRLLGR